MYSNSYKNYVTVLLLAIYIFNQADRQVIAFLMESIKRELVLSDSVLGFLAGPALVVFYVSLGVPIARLADRSNRINIMSIAITFWSCMAALSGMVLNFGQLILARVGVGVGEAGFSAVAQSLIGDYHTLNERTRAISIFILGIPLGIVFSSLVGGWINGAYGWRTTFIVIGLPGILLALLLKLTVREPRDSMTGIGRHAEGSSLKSILGALWHTKTLRHLAIGQGMANLVVASVNIWIVTFFLRVHGLPSAQLGIWMAVISGIGGCTGIWLSGILTSQPGQLPSNAIGRIVLATAFVPVMMTIVLWSPSSTVALVALFIAQLPLWFFFSPVMSQVQSLCASNERATMTAVFVFIQVTLGGIVGIQAVGLFSDLLAPFAGNSSQALRWSLTMTSLCAILGAVHFHLARRTIAADLARIQGQSSQMLELRNKHS